VSLVSLGFQGYLKSAKFCTHIWKNSLNSFRSREVAILWPSFIIISLAPSPPTHGQLCWLIRTAVAAELRGGLPVLLQTGPRMAIATLSVRNIFPGCQALPRCYLELTLSGCCTAFLTLTHQPHAMLASKWNSIF
jgi:hypothetical protein